MRRSAQEEAQAQALKRAIPKNYDGYDSRAIKPLAKMLWSLSVALGHAMTAHRQFTKVKSSTISPDGMVGGRGYVMAVKDIRTALHDACEAISTVSDTIHDELHAPHWKPRLAELEKADVEKVERLVGDAEKNLDDPEGEAEDELEEAEESGQVADIMSEAGVTKTASAWKADSSKLPSDASHSVPRVWTLDRGLQTGPLGSFNEDEVGSDAWSEGHLAAEPAWAADPEDWKAADSNLPNDGEPPVARSSVYDGTRSPWEVEPEWSDADVF